MGIRDERRRVLAERVAAQHDQVRELAGLERPLEGLLERGVSAVERADADRFFDADALASAPDGPVHVRAGDFGLQRHHRLEGARRVVGSLRRAHAGVDEAAQREHALEPRGAVLAASSRRGSRRRWRTASGSAPSALIRATRAWLMSVQCSSRRTAIAARPLSLQPLVDAEHDVDRVVTVCNGRPAANRRHGPGAASRRAAPRPVTQVLRPRGQERPT